MADEGPALVFLVLRGGPIRRLSESCPFIEFRRYRHVGRPGCHPPRPNSPPPTCAGFPVLTFAFLLMDLPGPIFFSSLTFSTFSALPTHRAPFFSQDDLRVRVPVVFGRESRCAGELASFPHSPSSPPGPTLATQAWLPVSWSGQFPPGTPRFFFSFPIPALPADDSRAPTVCPCRVVRARVTPGESFVQPAGLSHCVVVRQPMKGCGALGAIVGLFQAPQRAFFCTVWRFFQFPGAPFPRGPPPLRPPPLLFSVCGFLFVVFHFMFFSLSFLFVFFRFDFLDFFFP